VDIPVPYAILKCYAVVTFEKSEMRKLLLGGVCACSHGKGS